LRVPGSSPARWGGFGGIPLPLVVCGALALGVGCGGSSGSGPVPDAGPLPDGGITFFDASPGDAGPDAGGVDAGTDAGLASCGGPCDPTDPSGACGGDSCLLQAAVPACIASIGALGAGAPCTLVTDCAPGLACFQSGAGGICRAVCCPGGAEVCSSDERCGGLGILVDVSATQYRACLPRRPCTLPAGTGCQVGEACYFISSEGFTDCREEGTALVGEACSAPEDCAAGLSCLGAIAPTCRVICDDLSDCAVDEVCVSAQFPGLPGVGHCL